MKRNKKNEVFFLPLLGLLWILLLPGLGNEQGENGQIPSGGVGQQPDEEQGPVSYTHLTLPTNSPV